jgi:cytochrome c oxidase subunit II
MTPPAANPAAGVDQAFLYIIGFSLFFLVFITVLMIYFVFRYRAAKHPTPEDIRGNTKLEIAWMVIPTIIALSMFYFGWESYLGLRNVPENAMEIGVEAEMFAWTFTYPDGKKSRDLLVVPQGTPVKLNITSTDVIHSLSIPAFRIKMDAVKGMDTYAWFPADTAGDYKIFCTEYCGLGHSEMLADLRIVPPEEFRTWLAQQSETLASMDKAAMVTAPAQEGQIDLEDGFLHLEAKMDLFWKISGDQLRIRLKAPATGWVAVGFNPERGMKGANFILGAVSDGQVSVIDDYGTGTTRHESDVALKGRVDVTDVLGREVDGVTEVGFTIPLDSGDPTDTVIDPNGDTVVLLAFSDEDDRFTARHSYRAAFSVNLTTGESKKRRH